tara:strand:+ start:244 stop:426 length:183 start_codon:yes stop_codon:yes gene_type:complete
MEKKKKVIKNNLLIIFGYLLFMVLLIIILIAVQGCAGYSVCGYEDEAIELFENPDDIIGK